MFWSRISLALLPSALLLAGCGTSSAPVAATTYPDLTGNWQIQSNNAPGGSAVAQVLLLGALQNLTTSPNVSGTFRFSSLSPQPLTCALDQVVTLTGVVDSSRKLTLSSPVTASGFLIKAELSPSTIAAGFDNGTIEVDGGACALASSPALGVEVAPVNGTFTGQLMTIATGQSAAVIAGNASLRLAQSSAPGADGQFPLTGMLSYTLGTCSGMAALSGDASGVGLTLSAASAPLSAPAVSLFAVVDPVTEQIRATHLEISSFTCTGTLPAEHVYAATLSKQ